MASEAKVTADRKLCKRVSESFVNSIPRCRPCSLPPLSQPNASLEVCQHLALTRGLFRAWILNEQERGEIPAAVTCEVCSALALSSSMGLRRPSPLSDQSSPLSILSSQICYTGRPLLHFLQDLDRSRGTLSAELDLRDRLSRAGDASVCKPAC